MPEMPAGYYNRFDPADGYDEHLFRAGNVLQSAEMNEIQKAQIARLQGIGDVLFRDGSIISDCVVQVNADSGETTCSGGSLYLRGAVRGIAPADFTIPIDETIAIGVRVTETVVTEVGDADLVDPAQTFRNYGQPGAARLKVSLAWAWDGDGGTGDFFPIYTADNGVLRAKEAPPQLNAVSQALARYDRDSAGGSYVVRGMGVKILPDEEGEQVYSVARGSVRVLGRGFEFDTARRFRFAPAPDLRFVNGEPHVSSGPAPETFNFNLTPVANITELRITKEKTVNVARGAVAGTSDALPDATVVSLQSVTQGGTTYVAGVDYQLTAGNVDWSLAGAEPATGSTYSVTYRYIATVAADESDETSFTVSDAVDGTTIFVSYNQMLPRYDRLCVDEEGNLVLIRGVAASFQPMPPDVPDSLLKLVTIHQTWDENRAVYADGVKVVPMNELQATRRDVDRLFSLVAQQRLESSIHTRESGSLKGIFTDPFLDNLQRDMGQEQNGAIFNGRLSLPITSTVAYCDTRGGGAVSTLPFVAVSALEQLARTGEMKINPYLALDPIQSTVTLEPAVDRWVDESGVMIWDRITEVLTDNSLDSVTTRSEFIGFDDNTVTIESDLRPITVAFTMINCVVGEEVSRIGFDGVDVAPVGNPAADAEGVLSGEFVIPAGIPSGTKRVEIAGNQGSFGTATFIGEISRRVGIVERLFRNFVRGLDPLAQTFTLGQTAQIAGVDLWFMVSGNTPVEIQIRDTLTGLPAQTIFASARINPGDINTGGAPTRIFFDRPVTLRGGVEYALIALCTNPDAALGIASLGRLDQVSGNWVTEQPYQVGVLLSSSNASTWTPHQDRDLTFRLLETSYTATEHTVELGTVDVVDATDFLVRADIDVPASVATCRFSIELPGGDTFLIAADQHLRLDAAVTGEVTVSAVLEGSANFSPVLLSDVQLIWGVVDEDATYISRAVSAGEDVKARVIVEVDLPGSATCSADYKAPADGAWTSFGAPVASVVMSDGWLELTYESATFTKETIHTKLNLSGTTANRPRARNLRVLTL